MNRKQKESLVDTIRTQFAGAEASFLVSVKGLSVTQVQTLNKGVRQQGGRMQVVKNTLLKKAVEGFSCAEELSPFFKNQIAVVFAPKNSHAIAKLLNSAAKENEKIAITAGSFDQAFMNADRVQFLATLPAREVIIANFCGALKAPLTKHAMVLKELTARLARVLKAVEEKKSAE